jgi:uncharacterized RDD family membrane protein YckC
MQKAGFFIRLVAYIIDCIIVGVGAGVLMAVFGVPMSAGAGTASQIELGAMQGIGALLLLIWSLGYLLFFWATSGKTPGKAILGLQIVRTDGGKLGLGKAIVRLIGYAISGIVIYLGFLWILWDKEKQGWHDKIAGTYVIKK